MLNFLTEHYEPIFYIFIALTIFFLFNKGTSKFSIDKELKKIDKMKGIEFEQYIEELFQRMGYKVHRTQSSNDFGADIIVSKYRQKIAIQTKRYKSNVGLKAVQEIVAAKPIYKCNHCMVITNSFYTKSAVKLAKSNKVTLWDRDDLIKSITKVNTKGISIGKKNKRLTTV